MPKIKHYRSSTKPLDVRKDTEKLDGFMYPGPNTVYHRVSKGAYKRSLKETLKRTKPSNNQHSIRLNQKPRLRITKSRTGYLDLALANPAAYIKVLKERQAAKMEQEHRAMDLKYQELLTQRWKEVHNG